MKHKFPLYLFLVCILLALTAPLWVFKDLLFPFVTSKAFVFRIFIELALPVYIYLLVSNAKLRPKLRQPLNIAVCGFFVFALISALFGVNSTRALWGNFERMGGVFYLGHLVLLYFYLVCLGQWDGKKLKLVLDWVILIALFVALNGISGMLGGPIVVTDPSLPIRASSTLGNPIYLGNYAILPMVFALYFFLSQEGSSKKIYYGFAAACLLIGIYVSGTRGAFMGVLGGVFAGVFLFAVFSASKKVAHTTWLVVGGLVLVLALLFANASKFQTGSLVRRMFNLWDSNTSARLIQWKVALSGYGERPLLGTGPENYYVVSNKHFNPEIYKYDPSWFDKPHNYILEILITHGSIGFLFYLGLLWFVVYSIYRAFRSGFLSPSEAAVLWGGFVAYQIQILFVFENVSSSLTFFSFMAFAAFLNEAVETEPKSTGTGKKYISSNSVYKTAAWLSCVPVLYVLYVGNILPMQAAKAVNYGYAYASVDLQKSADYFERAVHSAFNFDQIETAAKFSDSVINWSQSPAVQSNPGLVLHNLEEAYEYQKSVTEATGNDPVAYQHLSSVYMMYTLANQRPISEANFEPINKALILAPGRVELMQAKLQMRGLQGKWPEALAIARQMVELNPNNLGVRMQLAQVLHLSGRTEEGIVEAEKLQAEKYEYRSIQEIQWIMQYYAERKEYAKALPLFERAAMMESRVAKRWLDLAQIYLLVGEPDNANNAAAQAISVDPKVQPEIDKMFQPH